MILPCEIAVRTMIPAIRATLARELIKTQGLTQNEVAEILGVSQSAVSKYTRQVRGYVMNIDNIKDVQPQILTMTNVLAKDTPRRTEFMRLFCQTCTKIRKQGLMCQFCRRAEPKIEEECSLCLDSSSV